MQAKGLLYFYLLILASTDDSCLKQLLLKCLPNGNFSIFTIPPPFIGWNSTEEENFLFFFLCLFILLYTQIFILFNELYKFTMKIFILLLRLSQVGYLEPLNVGSWVSSRCLHPFLSTFLLFVITRYPRLILYFSCPDVTSTINKKPSIPFTIE